MEKKPSNLFGSRNQRAYECRINLTFLDAENEKFSGHFTERMAQVRAEMFTERNRTFEGFSKWKKRGAIVTQCSGLHKTSI